MRINLAVIGAGSLMGQHLCRRAVRIGWDVHAYSMYDIEAIYKQSTSIRSRTFYNKESECDWLKHISWISDCNYDNNFEKLRDEIRNVTGLVYFYEETPALKERHNLFEEKVIKLSKLAGHWSVRHFIAVQSEEREELTLSNATQQAIGQTNPFMIVSLLRPGKVYSYSNLSSCFPVYKNRTLRSIGFDTQPTNVINAETVAKCITTLIHNTNDPNIYRILEAHDIEQYLSEQKVPFDSADYEYNDLEAYDNDESIDDDDDDSNNSTNDTDKKHNTISIGFNDTELIDTDTQRIESESVRDEQESSANKIL